MKDKLAKTKANRKKQALARIDAIEYEIIVLDNDLKTTSSPNQKIKINIRIVELVDEKNKIVDTILNKE